MKCCWVLSRSWPMTIAENSIPSHKFIDYFYDTNNGSSSVPSPPTPMVTVWGSEIKVGGTEVAKSKDLITSLDLQLETAHAILYTQKMTATNETWEPSVDAIENFYNTYGAQPCHCIEVLKRILF